MPDKYNEQEYDERTNAERERDTAIEELTEAIRFTVEYVGLQTLYPAPGWAWFDALVKYAPEKAQAFAKQGESIDRYTSPNCSRCVFHMHGVYPHHFHETNEHDDWLARFRKE